MIEVDEALSRVLSACESVGKIPRLVVDSIGYVLAEAITSDVDSPPHDKALVDGFAIRVADAGKQLRVLEHGYRIKVADTVHSSIGVDTPEDLVKVRQLLR